MTDDLRTRMIDVLKSAISDLASGYYSVQPDNLMFVDGGIYVDELADAVIRELGLTKETTSQNGPQMNKDDLVTRVWLKLVAHGSGWIDNGTENARCLCGHQPRLGESWQFHVADVLIRELKMEREHWQYGDGHTMGVRYRYVTEWETDQGPQPVLCTCGCGYFIEGDR